MADFNLNLLDAKYVELGSYFIKEAFHEGLFSNCSQPHDSSFQCNSEGCWSRQHFRLLFQEITTMYTNWFKEVSWRWEYLNKDIIDEAAFEYERTFKGHLVGLRTRQDVQASLASLEEKLRAFFNVVYVLLESMTSHAVLFWAVQGRLDEFNVFSNLHSQTYQLMNDVLARSLCPTEINLVMTLRLCFNLKLRLLLPTEKISKATVCPFLVKAGSDCLKIAGKAPDRAILEYGPVDEDLENYFLVPAAEAYDLRMPGVAAQKVTGTTAAAKRKHKESAEAVPLLKRNETKFAPTSDSSVPKTEWLEADLSKIRLEAISRAEQQVRRTLTSAVRVEPPARPPAPAKGGFKEKMGRTFSGGKKAAGAKSIAVEPTLAHEPKQRVGEILHCVFLTVDIDVANVSFRFYKKIKVPVAVASNANQRCEGYGSAIWNIIVWLEEAAKLGSHPALSMADGQYQILHAHFTETYLRGMMNVLTRVKDPQSPEKKTSGATASQVGHESDEEFSISLNSPGDSLLSDEECQYLTLDSLDVDFSSINLYPVPSHLNDRQFEFLSLKLASGASVTGLVTRQSLLGDLNTTTSFFYWFYYTCQAISKNFGLKSTGRSWFGDPKRSVWHSDFVIGYIGDTEADEALKSFGGSKHLLLIRFSGSAKQSVVVHMMAGSHGPVQRTPVVVGLVNNGSDSLEAIMKNSLFTPNYQFVTYDSQGTFRLKPKSDWDDWTRRFNTDISPTSPGKSAAEWGVAPPDPTDRPTGQYARGMEYDKLHSDARLHLIMGELNLNPHCAGEMAKLLEAVQRSDEEADQSSGLEMLRSQRQLLRQHPEILSLLKSVATRTVTSDK